MYLLIFNCRDASKAVIEMDGQKLNGNRIPVEHGKVIFFYIINLYSEKKSLLQFIKLLSFFA